MQIAVYAVNCSNSDEYVDEVAKLIKNYAEHKMNEAISQYQNNILGNIEHKLYKYICELAPRNFVPEVLPCPYCKTDKNVIHNTHGLNDQCWKCGTYVRKPYLSEQL